jgi:hypothetical protein
VPITLQHWQQPLRHPPTPPDQLRQTKCNNHADKLTVAAKTLAKPKVEKAVVESRRKVEGDLGPVKYVATLLGADNETVLRWFILVVALNARPRRCLAAPGGDADTAISARRRAGRL